MSKVRLERMQKHKAELLELCDNDPNYVQREILKNIDARIAELKPKPGTKAGDE